MRNSDTGIEQTKIVINLRHRSYGGTRIAVRRLLVYGNRRRQSLQTLDIRLFHLPQKLPRIRRKRLHITALSLRINRIKSKGRFSGTTQTCQHNELVPWNIQINIL